MNNIVKFPQFHKKLINTKMLVLVIAIGFCAGYFLWKFNVENIANLDVKIPQSSNKTYNIIAPQPLTTTQIANKFEEAENRPILLYIYTTWCPSCNKNLPIFNEIAREFQNTDLKVIALAIDRNLDAEALQEHHNKFGDIFFEPNFLTFKDGFIEFLRKRNIAYKGRIPYTVIIGRNGNIVAKYSGAKDKNYLRNNIIKELYPN